MKASPRSLTEKIWFIIFAAAASLLIFVELFQALGFLLLHDFMRPYSLAILLFTLSVALALVFSIARKYLPCLIFTVAGSVGLTAVGYMLAHPATDADYYINGVSTSVFWKFFAPSLLLIIPAAALFVIAAKRKKAERESQPYEKQF